MDLNHWLLKLGEKWNLVNVSFHGYTKLPSMVSELPSLVSSPRTISFRSLRSMRQAIIIGCVLLVITIAALFRTLNASFTLHGLSPYRDAIYVSNQAYCNRYKGKAAPDVHKIFAALARHIPPEDQQEELLREANGTGAILTHNTAVKAREYVKVFEAWANLHLSSKDNSFYSREDIVQSLHCQANSASKVSGSMNESQILQTIQLYDTYRFFVTNMGLTLFPWTAPYFPDHLSLYSQIRNGGRGIVFTTGNNQVSYILTSIVTIRKLGCNLPIEVMYHGAGDLSLDNRRRLESFPGIVTRNLEHLIYTGSEWDFEGFDMKPFAVLVSSFREAILVDADVGFLKNPECLFNDPGYVETGTLFFYDRIHSRNEKRINWLRMAIPEPLSGRVNDKIAMSNEIDATREDQESGVVVFDKSKHFIPLLLIAWLNGPNRHGPGGEEPEDKGFYDIYYGDKDSYWFGMELAGDPNYSFSSGALAATGNLTKIVQYTFDQQSRDAVKIEEYPYNSSHAGDAIHRGRTVSVYDRDLKICSYQMIHMDRDQSPLWYNGWISDDKKPSLGMRNVWQFEHYMLEPEVNGNQPWSWVGGNKGCLGGRELVSLTESEKAVFHDATQAAIDLGIVKTGN